MGEGREHLARRATCRVLEERTRVARPQLGAESVFRAEPGEPDTPRAEATRRPVARARGWVRGPWTNNNNLLNTPAALRLRAGAVSGDTATGVRRGTGFLVPCPRP